MSKGIEQITALLHAPGVKQQQLPNVVINASYNHKDEFTKITFGTTCCDVLDATEGRNVVGIILWIPRDEYDKVVTANKD